MAAIKFVSPHTSGDVIMRITCGGIRAEFRGRADGSFSELVANERDRAYLTNNLVMRRKLIAEIFAHYMQKPTAE